MEPPRRRARAPASDVARRSVAKDELDAGAILEALPASVIVIDRNERICFVNSAAEQFLGSGIAALCGSALTDFVRPHASLASLIDSVWRVGNTISEYDVLLEVPRYGGRSVTIQGALAGDGADKLVLTLHERSMAEKMDRQFSHRNAARSITAMAAMLAHEVKNPLSGIRGAAQLIEQDTDAAGRELTQLICDETDRIVALVDRMEAFSDHQPINPEAVNIHELLERVRKVAQSGFARNARLVEEYDPSLPPVRGNRDLLVQVFLNLVKNAAEGFPVRMAKSF